MRDKHRGPGDIPTAVSSFCIHATVVIASEATSVTNCANLRFLVYIFASEASLLHELAGAFLWYIYIFLYPWVDHLVPRGPRVTRNAQTSDRPV